ncbi:hypothetical protein BaRGS_00013504, partial [Batillaria attramentaria]
MGRDMFMGHYETCDVTIAATELRPFSLVSHYTVSDSPPVAQCGKWPDLKTDDKLTEVLIGLWSGSQAAAFIAHSK